MEDAPHQPDDLDYFGEDAATFGDRMAAAREAQGLSQGDLAARLGVLLRTVRNWEEDRSEPRANKLQMLCGLLNVSMMWLLSGEGDGPDAAEAALDGDARDLLIELRSLRANSVQLAARIGRLEKRLKGVLG